MVYKNKWDEDDPREMENDVRPAESTNAALTALRNTVKADAPQLPTTAQLAATGATLEELLYELYLQGYHVSVEPHDPMRLGDMRLPRREKVRKWRNFFFVHLLGTIRGYPDALIFLYARLLEMWADMIEINRAEN